MYNYSDSSVQYYFYHISILFCLSAKIKAMRYFLHSRLALLQPNISCLTSISKVSSAARSFPPLATFSAKKKNFLLVNSSGKLLFEDYVPILKEVQTLISMFCI